ncbi:MAG: alanine racemase [Patescibacteria group bacterium]|nr:alanine racemase [Patescibacteria group bacterium]
MALTWIEISQANLLHNLAQFKKICPHSQIWPVIKSNAYGHGWEIVAGILDKVADCSGLMVVSLKEALALAKHTDKPIMVLSFFEKSEAELITAAKYNISLPLYDLETADYLSDLAQKNHLSFSVNIKIDTGTSRLGFRTEEATEAINQIKAKDSLSIFSIFTHYAESESEDLSFSHKQLDDFLKIKKTVPEIKMHSACSAAALGLSSARQDIVRLGLSLYGLWSSPAAKTRGHQLGISLEPVLSLKTKIIQVKKILKGESVGYNRTYKVGQDMQLAIIPVGYYDGYSRLLSNKAKVLIKGKEYNIRGNVCMNLSMIEVPLADKVRVGDIITLIGADGQVEIKADELAYLSQTINYETVTRLNPNIKRIVV